VDPLVEFRVGQPASLAFSLPRLGPRHGQHQQWLEDLQPRPQVPWLGLSGLLEEKREKGEVNTRSARR
jgi:hypothetical protein